jgi:tetratricopeptide (TPR) repeat protein
MLRLGNALLFLVLILTPFIAFAQSNPSITVPRLGTIRGQVKLADGRPAAMGYVVYLEQRSGGNAGQTQTDRLGKFEFQQVPSDIYRVMVHAPGFAPVEQEVNLLSIMNSYVELTLRPASGGSADAPGGTISALDAQAPPEARKFLEEGQSTLMSGKDLDKSVESFQKAIHAYPKYVQAYVLLGVAYSSQKKWEDAEKPFQKAIQLDKTSAPAYVGLGSVENERHNFPEAEKNLKQAVQLAPNSADAYLELGRTYWGMSNWDAADASLRKAIQLRPIDSAEHLLHANVLLRKRDAPGALAEFKESLRLDPTGPFADQTKQMIDKIETALKSAKQ